MEGNNRWRSVALTVLLIASPWLAVQGWIVAAAHDPEHTTMPTCPDPTANCASLSSQSVVRMDAGLTTLIQANVSEVWDAWVEWSDDNGLRKGHSALGEGGERFAHGVAITPFWRFPDDVVVQFTPQGEATAIALYSASRLGWATSASTPIDWKAFMMRSSPFRPPAEPWSLVPSVGEALVVNEHDVHAHARLVKTDELDFMNRMTARGTAEHGKRMASEERAFSRLFLLG